MFVELIQYNSWLNTDPAFLEIRFKNMIHVTGTIQHDAFSQRPHPVPGDGDAGQTFDSAVQAEKPFHHV